MASISKPQQQQQENTAVEILKNFTTENKYYWCIAQQKHTIENEKYRFSDILQSSEYDPQDCLLSFHASYPYILKSILKSIVTSC